MENKTGNKTELISQELTKLKNIKHEQKLVIERLAKVQQEMKNADVEDFSDKISEIFLNESKNHEVLKELLNNFEAELNKLCSKTGKRK